MVAGKTVGGTVLYPESERLTRLEALDPRLAQVVEYRFFAGLSQEETAELLSVSLSLAFSLTLPLCSCAFDSDTDAVAYHSDHHTFS